MVALSLAFAVGTHALERVATDPHDDLRSANSALIKNASKPAACVAGVMTDAAAPCPVACMIRSATAALPKADSCAAGSWACGWPKQMLGTTAACPAGWTGTYGVNVEYEVQGCGSVLAETGVKEVTSSGCTRTRTETKIEACPTGGGWAGAGVTKTRTVNEKLEMDLTTVTVVSTTDWAVSSVACTRVVDTHSYVICPLESNTSCMRELEQNTGVELSSTCTTTPVQANETRMSSTQHLNNDLTTVTTDSSSAGESVRNDCVLPLSLCESGKWMWGAGGGCSSKYPTTPVCATGIEFARGCTNYGGTCKTLMTSFGCGPMVFDPVTHKPVPSNDGMVMIYRCVKR